MGERSVRNAEVRGSIPLISTNNCFWFLNSAGTRLPLSIRISYHTVSYRTCQ